MKKVSFAAFIIAAVMLGGGAFAQTRIIIPESELEFKANEDYSEVTITCFEPKNKNGICDYDKYRDKELELPSKIQGVPVTKIEGSPLGGWGNSVSRATRAKLLYIPDSVKIIGPQAFFECQFERVRLPEELKEISCELFKDSYVKNVTIPESVKKIGRAAFANCISLESIVIPKNVEEIENEAFASSGIKTLTVTPSFIVFYYMDPARFDKSYRAGGNWGAA